MDVSKGKFMMPWVRLHAVKAYYDMARALERFENVQVTVNFVPSLVKQLNGYCQGKSDMAMDISLKEPKELTEDERAYVIDNFFSANWDRLVRKYTRYSELLDKRLKFGSSGGKTIQANFSDSEIGDLMALFNLAWCGEYAMRDEPFLKQLSDKGRGYSREDISTLIGIHLKLVEGIVPKYRELSEQGRMEITTSPYYHPIMPLVIDTDSARRNMPEASLPMRFSATEDARAQVAGAVAAHEQAFGIKPKGMWPSEGGVSPEAVEVMAGEGIEWAATDEDILFETLGSERSAEKLYQPHIVNSGTKELTMFFRDRPLSDVIGFTYANMSASDAVSDFVSHIHSIADSFNGDSEPIVSVILDGENPWENYESSGVDFLETLYGTLEKDPDINPTTFSEYLKEHPPESRVSNLFTGSWINHDFGIWIGEVEENNAWEVMGKVRERLKSVNIEPDKRAQAWDELYAAEGSDWFWWYGDDFNSAQDAEFDYLFRAHLRNALSFAGAAPMEELEKTILLPHAVVVDREPTGFITPEINGQISNYYEWQAAGELIATGAHTAMFMKERFIERVMYGFNKSTLYLRIDPMKNAEINRVEFDLNIVEDEKIIIAVKLKEISCKPLLIKDKSKHKEIADLAAAFNDILEVAAPFDALGLESGQKVELVVRLFGDEHELSMYPKRGFISITIPEPDFEERRWQV